MIYFQTLDEILRHFIVSIFTQKQCIELNSKHVNNMSFLYHLLCGFYSNAFGTRTFVLLNDFFFFVIWTEQNQNQIIQVDIILKAIYIYLPYFSPILKKEMFVIFHQAT